MNITGSDRKRRNEGRERPDTAVAMSDLLCRGLAEDALRLEHHEDDEDREDHRLSPGLAEPEAVVEGLDDADEEAADHGAGEVPDTAEHRRREGEEPESEAGVPARDLDGLHVEDARRAGERAAEAEGEGDRAVDVDAHQAGGVLVLRGGSHRL